LEPPERKYFFPPGRIFVRRHAAALFLSPALAIGLPAPAREDAGPPAIPAAPVPAEAQAAPWTLEWLAGEAFGSIWRDDDGFCRLAAGGDLAIRMPDPRFAAFRNAGRTSVFESSRWVLRDSRGRRTLEGVGQPSSSRILEALSAAGYRTSWARREAFLRENPEQCEAWLDAVLRGFRLAQFRVARLEGQGLILPSGPHAPAGLAPGQRRMAPSEMAAQMDACFAEMAEGLEGLLKVREWASGRPDFLWMRDLRGSGIGESPRMRKVLGRLRAEMLEAWRREPESARAIFGAGWVALGETLGEDTALPDELRPRSILPGPEPLRLVCHAQAPWGEAWKDLQEAEALLPWTLDGLRWEWAAEIPVALRERHGWGQAPRWVLLRGEDAFASGEACPSPQHLADKLAAAGPARLQRLDAWIVRQPDSLDAHRKRFELLLPRMPIRNLEWSLAEDARRAWIPLTFGPEAAWRPDADLWAKAAQKVMPELEDALRRWPSSQEFWRAYVSWSAFHPQRPSALVLANRLVPWGSHRRWLAGLPLDVHRALADGWRSRGEFEAMRLWFRETRDGFGPFPEDPLEREAWVKAVQPVSDYLRAALVGLNRVSEVQSMDSEWQWFMRRTPAMRR
jgi:hypothetical protein